MMPLHIEATMDRDTAAQHAAAHLQLSGHAVVTTSPHSKPSEGHVGAVLQMRRRGADWIAQLWPDADTYTVEKAAERPPPARRVVVDAVGVVSEEALTAAGRRAPRSTGRPRGRPKSLAPGQRRSPRIHFTPDAEDREAIRQLALDHELTEAEVVAALVASKLRRKKLPWKG